MLVYEALATLNQHFEQTLRDLNQLEELCFFPQRWQRKLVKTWRATVEESRAWANFEVLEVLHEEEEREWVRFGRIVSFWKNNPNLKGWSHPPNQPSGRHSAGPKKGTQGAV